LGIPFESLSRAVGISALLELADKEFSEVDTSITVLRAKYEKGLRSGNLQIEINRDSVEIFLSRSKTVAKLRAVATKVGVSNAPSAETLTHLVQTISAAGFSSIEEVDELLRPDVEPEARLTCYLKSYVARRQKGGAVGIGMSDAFLVRLTIFLTLPKAKALEILSKHPFVNTTNTGELRAAINQRS
jgi:hypothetical protein